MVDGSAKTAEEMAKEQRAVSVSEFFERNRHLLGYDNPTKALLTVVKEIVDNSLDACEEARILPRIHLEIKQKTPDIFRVVGKDNGPGIVDKQIPYTMAKLLYGSKFFKLYQSRGQQGLGIKGCVLYSQLTTGKPTTVISSTGDGKTSYYELMIDVKRNEPDIISHRIEDTGKVWHGLKIEMDIEGRYIESKASVPEYIRQVAIANPYAEIVFDGPNGKIEYLRGASILPPLPKEIKPHPEGIELGIFRRMLESTKSRNIVSFLMNDFSRVGRNSAEEIVKLADIDPNKQPQDIDNSESEKLFKALKKVKLMRPPTDCLSPLGEDLLLKGMQKEIKAEFFAAITRPTAVYRGNPFVVECGIAYGGELSQEGSVEIMRFSNKVPLLYQAGDCAITKAIATTDWKRYGLQQSGNSLPTGPAVILVHFASVWVPFVSESKQAIASYPIIIKEIKLGLQELGRRLQRHVSGKRRAEMQKKRRKIFERYIPEVAMSLHELTSVNAEIIKNKLNEMIEKKLVKIDIEQEEVEKDVEKRSGRKVSEIGEENSE
ncbi:MAG: DNA topoisomerase VI subunit B [Fervidobacterium sp.]